MGPPIILLQENYFSSFYQNVTTSSLSVLRVLQSEDAHKRTKERMSDTNRRLEQSLAALQELGQENQSIQMQQNFKLSRQWQDDSLVTNCKSCEKLFSLTVRKVKIYYTQHSPALPNVFFSLPPFFFQLSAAALQHVPSLSTNHIHPVNI